jgi:DNA-binding beta-propeller fold protein YncE
MGRIFKLFSMATVMVLLFTSAAMAATIYSTGNDGTSLIAIDTNTGAASVVGSSGYSETWAAAFTPDGTLWTIINGFTNGQLATFNLLTGAAAPVGSPAGTDDVIALEANNAGTLYAAGFDGSFYTVNTTTGQLTLVGNMGFPYIMDMAFDNSGTLWAVAETGPNGNDLYTINPATGTGTLVCILNGVSGAMGLMVDPATNIMYGTDYYNQTPYLYQINPVACTATPIGSGLGVGYPHGGDILPIQNIPTMNEWGMIIFAILAGVGSVYYLRRRYGA